MMNITELEIIETVNCLIYFLIPNEFLIVLK